MRTRFLASQKLRGFMLPFKACLQNVRWLLHSGFAGLQLAQFQSHQSKRAFSVRKPLLRIHMLKRMEVALSKRECTYAPLHSARDFEAVRIAWLVIMLSLFCRDILIGLPGSQKIRIAPIDTMHLHVDELGLQFKISKFSKFPHL
jgi:hypothetical protein